MKANAQPLCEILSNNVQFLVPFFQRSYSWNRDNWERLGEDIQTLLAENLSRKHFMGPLVCALQSAVPGKVSQYQLIDGQQRLTTLSVLLTAIRDEAIRVDETDLADEIETQFLVNPYKNGINRYKLVPRTGDRELFSALVNVKPTDDASSRLVAAHEFFTKFIRTHAHNDDGYLRNLFDTVVSRLFLVSIMLDEEDPYEIFESLNSTGLPLQESDLIRNFLFMQIPLEEQEDFQNDHWAPFEAQFDPLPGKAALDATGFYRDFLMREGKYSKSKETFNDFKRHYEEQKLSPSEMVALLKRFIGHAKAIVNHDSLSSPQVASALRQFVWMEASTAFPVVLNLLERRHQGTISDDDFVDCVSAVNSFILRRSICGESTRGYGKLFCTLAGQLEGDPKSQIRGYLLGRGWPDDETFERSLVEFPIYRREFKKCRIVLEQLERSDGHKEVVDLEKIQIEHVMPQKLPNGKAGQEWKGFLGDRPKRTHERLVHTLGNLTLTGYNPKLSNRAFSEKRKELTKSKLSLNKIFEITGEKSGVIEPELDWNEKQIIRRGKTLAAEVSQLWPRPDGDVEYLPPAKSTRSGTKTKQRRKEYWATLAEMLHSSGVSVRPVRQIEGRICDFYLPMADVNLSARLVTHRNQLTVTFQFTRSRGKQIYDVLVADRDSIDMKFETPPSWDDGKKPTITFARHNVSIRERYDWLDQHNWIIAMLLEIENDLLGRIRLLNGAVKEKSESKQNFLDFWVGFHQLLFDRNSQLQGTSPQPYHWNGFAIGRSGISLEAVIRPSKSTMTVMLLMGTKMSPVFFPQLAADKQAIESEFGSPLFWNDSSELKQWRVEASASGVDFADRAKWPEYQRWIFERLHAFDRVFRDRIQGLAASSAGND
ncbi:DUF4268 domain-containing protein [Rosistilla oblonga]|uniref:DUF4268 domain-containing protein n=1 Tax=Rosistilla oblonga TaxID=2527990 RepID=UPI003A984157